MARFPSASSYVDDSLQFTTGIEDAVKSFARSKPWVGTPDEQFQKLQAIHDSLCSICEVTVGLQRVEIEVGERALIGYSERRNAILIAGRLSVVTYLFAFARVLFGDARQRQMAFAVNLYKRCFPRSFARADLSGPTVRTR
jgi:hypothetical protein